MKVNCGEFGRRWYCETNPDDCDEWPGPVPTTNADRIRAMSDEGLAELIVKHKPLYSWPKAVREIWMQRNVTKVQAWVTWLQQPAEGERHENLHSRENQLIRLDHALCVATDATLNSNASEHDLALFSTIRRKLRNLPTVDAVEVVRCRECAIPHNKYTGCPKLNGMVTLPDFYCPYGERRTDG